MSTLSDKYNEIVNGVRNTPIPGQLNVQPFRGNNPIVSSSKIPSLVAAPSIFQGGGGSWGDSNGSSGGSSSFKPSGDASMFLDANGKLLHPDVFAQNIASKLPGGDVPKYAGDSAMNPNQTAMQLNQTQAGLTNSANDIATGTTDPYKVGAQSGINYTPAELNAIEKAYAGIYDPAINDVHAKLQAKQDMDKLRMEHEYRMEEANTKTGANLNGLTLGDYAKTTSNGNSYIDLSTVSDKAEKKLVENAARLNGIPIVTDTNSAKINAIEDTRTNLDNIKAQFDKFGYQNGLTRTLGGFGGTNRIAELFGDTDIGSFNSWRTAAINSIQALAGGMGSGLRINQAEINAAMENDIPRKGDTIAVGHAKMDNLKKQLDSWEEILLGTKGANSNSSENTQGQTVTAPDGTQVTITD